jgi:prohibitin 2
MSGGFPKNFQDLQRQLARAQEQGRKFGGGSGGNPRSALGGLVGLVLFGGGAVVLNNSLFNGMI